MADSDSILNGTKKILGLTPEYTAFDVDILTHINSAFATLHQLGVGPAEPYEIYDASADWYDFTGGKAALNSVRSYVYLHVRLIFDPPASSYALNALKEQMKEYEWRLSALAAEGV